jgi:hypothetical protein
MSGYVYDPNSNEVVWDTVRGRAAVSAKLEGRVIPEGYVRPDEVEKFLAERGNE